MTAKRMNHFKCPCCSIVHRKNKNGEYEIELQEDTGIARHVKDNIYDCGYCGAELELGEAYEGGALLLKKRIIFNGEINPEYLTDIENMSFDIKGNNVTFYGSKSNKEGVKVSITDMAPVFYVALKSGLIKDIDGLIRDIAENQKIKAESDKIRAKAKEEQIASLEEQLRKLKG